MKKKVGGYVGVVTISNEGEPGIFFNSKGMAWSMARDNVLSWGILEGDEKTQILH